MIVRAAEIYARTARRHKLDQELVTSVGECIFKELMERMVVPNELAYELDHVGTFAIRHKKFHSRYGHFQRNYPDHVFIDNWRNVPAMIQGFIEAKEGFTKRRQEYEAKKQS